MTRDEAINIFRGVHYSNHPDASAKAIDGFVKLGMLKLDEPKTVHEKFCEAMNQTSTRISLDWFFHVLDKAGLKLTEK
jgi:hypothetical protein